MSAQRNPTARHRLCVGANELSRFADSKWIESDLPGSRARRLAADAENLLDIAPWSRNPAHNGLQFATGQFAWFRSLVVHRESSSVRILYVHRDARIMSQDRFSHSAAGQWPLCRAAQTDPLPRAIMPHHDDTATNCPETRRRNMEKQTQTAPTGSPATVSLPQTEVMPEQLDEVIGGLQFSFKLVAVKTISWAHD
jgi:hypothetical protein